MTESERLQGTT
jgi:hypothetical protein